MKFSALSILAFAAAAIASPTFPYDSFEYKFDAQVWLQNEGPLNGVAIKKVDSHPFVFSVGGDEGENLTLTLNDRKRTLIDQDGTGVYINPDTGEVGSVSGTQSPTEGFEYSDDIVTYEGHTEWKACPSGENKYSLVYGKDCDGGISLDIKTANLQKIELL